VEQLSKNQDSGELETPLQVAVSNNHIEVVKLLLKHQANVQVLNKKKQTLLHIACENGNEAMIRLLLNTNIDRNALSCDHFSYEIRLSAIHIAANCESLPA
jgi:ankyrin repeat protein